jgi:hypothetical protein
MLLKKDKITITQAYKFTALQNESIPFQLGLFDKLIDKLYGGTHEKSDHRDIESKFEIFALMAGWDNAKIIFEGNSYRIVPIAYDYNLRGDLAE